ncbi:MAG: hypothetical protein PHQ58_14430 [Rhodoferax sp.]|uniref:hypothetical protein n=1 Tax=Rhodoferax sp. TaxID=50421 RepID=UPI002620E4FB|nr:hypothetical protein [Rhodoferax sp.]MDD2881623.1 hypothetical protein [Rhodoferax sp.]
MSLIDWLMPKFKSHKDATSPVNAAAPSRPVPNAHGSAPDVDLKAQRQERRERLYAVVREAMLRSEVLASRYKFKVLSLDTHGRQFLVMVDLLDAKAVAPERFAVIEQLIISHAAQQHGMYVKSVYWRVNDVPAVMPTAPAHHVSAPQVQVAPVAVPPPISTSLHAPVFDPIDQAEVLAFKKAMGVTPSSPIEGGAGQVRTSGPRHAPVPTGYEDTQLLEQPDDTASPLSRTQFGEL